MMLTGDAIASLMSQEGPIVKAVVLRAGGAVDEITMDLTPKKNELAKLLGGASASIVGQFNVLDTVLLKKRDREDKDKKNSHKLPHPLHEEEHFGDLVLVRMNKEANPESFTKAEWTKFLKDAPFTPEAYEAWKIKYKVEDEAEEEDEDDDEEEDEDEDEDEDEQEEDPIDIEAFLVSFRKSFKDEHKRLPTPEEEAEVLELVQAGAGDEDDEDEPEDLTEEEEELVEKVLTALSAKLKREPTDEEVSEALLKVPGGEAIVAKVMSGDDEEEEEDGEDLELEEEEAELLEKTASALATKLNRDPSEEEIIQALMKVPGGEAIVAKIMSGAGDDDDEEDEEEELTEEESALLEKTSMELSRKLKRPFSEEEIFAALMKKPGGKELVAKLKAMEEEGDEEDEDDDEEDDEDEDEEEEEVKKKPAPVPARNNNNRPAQGNNRPAQGNNRPGQGNNRPGQGNNNKKGGKPAQPPSKKMRRG